MNGRHGGAPRRTILALVAAVLGATSAACDGLLGTDQAAFAADARVLLSGTSPVPLLLVTSTNFTAEQDFVTGELITNLIVSDTITLATPTLDQHFEILGADRFLVRLINPDLNETADIHLRVELDGRQVYNQRATMRDASLEYTAFYQPGGGFGG
jgi:hypothetical protein